VCAALRSRLNLRSNKRSFTTAGAAAAAVPCYVHSTDVGASSELDSVTAILPLSLSLSLSLVLQIN